MSEEITSIKYCDRPRFFGLAQDSVGSPDPYHRWDGLNRETGACRVNIPTRGA